MNAISSVRNLEPGGRIRWHGREEWLEVKGGGEIEGPQGGRYRIYDMPNYPGADYHIDHVGGGKEARVNGLSVLTKNGGRLNFLWSDGP